MPDANNSPQKWAQLISDYWHVTVIGIALIGWVITWNARLDAHEAIQIKHIKQDREIVRLLRDICRKMPGDKTTCNRKEDEDGE